MSLKEDLIAAKALIDTPEKWIKGDYERNGCFCILGALQYVCSGALLLRLRPALEALEQFLPRYTATVWIFNDAKRTTHADIMSLFDRAIEAAS